MSEIFMRNRSVCATGKAQHPRRNRHKKYRVPPEARGKGYETYGIPGGSGSLQRHESPTADPTPDATVPAAYTLPTTPAQGPTIAAAATEWEKVSEKGTSLLAARNGLRLWCTVVVLLTMFVFLFGYRGWFWRVFDWMHQFPMPMR